MKNLRKVVSDRDPIKVLPEHKLRNHTGRFGVTDLAEEPRREMFHTSLY